MQTNFTLAQLANSDTGEANKILRTCVHCGFCNATCPTYLELGDELDGPRGRIYLVKDILEQSKPATALVAKHIDRCLSCLACMTTCPSGVNYMHLVDQARQRIETTFRRALPDRLLRSLLAAVLPSPRLFRLALVGAFLAKPFKAVLPARLKAMVDLAPSRLPVPSALYRTRLFPADGQREQRVALLAVCAQQVLAPRIDEATIRLLNRYHCDVVIAEGQACCGSLTHHMGRDSRGMMKAAIDAWTREIDGDGLDAIVINVSGCGVTVKDYGYILRDDPAYAEKAARVSALARDISEYLATLALLPVTQTTGQRVAYHAACSLQHGQRILNAPKELLVKAGFVVVEPQEGHICCGSAGTYNMLQPELAQALRARKIGNIVATSPELIATGNIGCITQIQSGLDVPVVHTVELLDWATGGPRPMALAAVRASAAAE